MNDDTTVAAMSSQRPYLLRAIHEWISDNGMTPHLLVNADFPGVHVPPGTAKDGKVVLNIAERAVGQLSLGNDYITFGARFGGVAHEVFVPVAAVLAIYSRETGQGMALPEDVTHDADTGEESGDDAPATDTPPDDHTPPPGGKRPPFLRVVK